MPTGEFYIEISIRTRQIPKLNTTLILKITFSDDNINSFIQNSVIKVTISKDIKKIWRESNYYSVLKAVIEEIIELDTWSDFFVMFTEVEFQRS